MSDFFEYKYLVMDDFYQSVCKEKYTYTQAGGRCIYAFLGAVDESDIKFLAVYSTILSQIAKYGENLPHFKEYYLRLIKSYNSLPINELLTENEREYLEDDIDWIKDKFEEA